MILKYNCPYLFGAGPKHEHLENSMCRALHLKVVLARHAGNGGKKKTGRVPGPCLPGHGKRTFQVKNPVGGFWLQNRLFF